MSSIAYWAARRSTSACSRRTSGKSDGVAPPPRGKCSGGRGRRGPLGSRRPDGGRSPPIAGSRRTGSAPRGSVREDRDDLERVSATAPRRVPGPGRLGCEPEALRAPDDGVELSEVVEEQTRGRRRPESGRHVRIDVQVAQDAVAEPAIGDLAELLLHRLERGGVVRAAAHLERHGEDRREPAHGAREVEVGEALHLATMALEVDPEALPSGPVAEGHPESGEQHVVHLGAVGLVRSAKQGLGLARLEADPLLRVPASRSSPST